MLIATVPDEELIVNSMATLIEKLLHSMAEKMRFCVFMMDHGMYMLLAIPAQGYPVPSSVFSINKNRWQCILVSTMHSLMTFIDIATPQATKCQLTKHLN